MTAWLVQVLSSTATLSFELDDINGFEVLLRHCWPGLCRLPRCCEQGRSIRWSQCWPNDFAGCSTSCHGRWLRVCNWLRSYDRSCCRLDMRRSLVRCCGRLRRCFGRCHRPQASCCARCDGSQASCCGCLCLKLSGCCSGWGYGLCWRSRSCGWSKKCSIWKQKIEHPELQI